MYRVVCGAVKFQRLLSDFFLLSEVEIKFSEYFILGSDLYKSVAQLELKILICKRPCMPVLSTLFFCRL